MSFLDINTTHSTWLVWGNWSTGCTVRRLYPPSQRILRSPDLQDRIQADRVTALAGRIHNDQVHFAQLSPLFRFLYIIRQDFLRFAHIKTGVLNVIESRVPAGVFDGSRNDLYAVDLSRPAGQEEGDGSDTAVEVPDNLPVSSARCRTRE